MATEQRTAEYILEQAASAGAVRIRKMFGEYALYCDDKPVAFICDDQLFLKITDAGRAIIKSQDTGLPYPKAKPYFVVAEEDWDDHDYLGRLVRTTADALPTPKPKN